MDWHSAMNWRTNLRTLVDVIPEADTADGIGELERLKSILMQRLLSPNGDAPPPAPPETFLTAAQVAERLNVSKQFCYDHQELLGATKIGSALRFSEKVVKRWLIANRK